MELTLPATMADGSYLRSAVMAIVIGVALAGAFGAVARYELDGFISDPFGSAFPWGTFVINISGALLLGFLFTVLTGRYNAPPLVRSSIMTGLLGAYTTFSTLTLETARLIEDGSYGLAVLNSVGGLVCGMVAVFVGILAGRAFA